MCWWIAQQITEHSKTAIISHPQACRRTSLCYSPPQLNSLPPFREDEEPVSTALCVWSCKWTLSSWAVSICLLGWKGFVSRLQEASHFPLGKQVHLVPRKLWGVQSPHVLTLIWATPTDISEAEWGSQEFAKALLATHVSPVMCFQLSLARGYSHGWQVSTVICIVYFTEVIKICKVLPVPPPFCPSLASSGIFRWQLIKHKGAQRLWPPSS